MKKLFIFLGLFFSLLTFTFIVNVNNVNATESGLIDGAKSGILIEETTKEVLYSKNENDKLSPASMTKIMTLLLIYEALDKKLFEKNTMLTANEEACSMGGSQVYLKLGEKISVDEALKCVCIVSANDCAVLFATTISGTEKQFVNKMNEKAQELGLKNTQFNDATGLSSENHYSSAYDMAIIARELIVNHPDVLNYTSIKEDYIRKNTSSPFWLVNTNKFAGRVDGVMGLKTGYTSFSGYCITLYMNKNNMGLISVVFGYDTKEKRNSESLGLLMYGFSNYEMKLLVKKNQTFVIVTKPIYKNKFEIVSKDDIRILTKTCEDLNYSIDYDYKITKNSLDGKVSISYNNKVTEGLLINSDKIKRRNIFEITAYLLKKIFVYNVN